MIDFQYHLICHDFTDNAGDNEILTHPSNSIDRFASQIVHIDDKGLEFKVGLLPLCL